MFSFFSPSSSRNKLQSFFSKDVFFFFFFFYTCLFLLVGVGFSSSSIEVAPDSDIEPKPKPNSASFDPFFLSGKEGSFTDADDGGLLLKKRSQVGATPMNPVIVPIETKNKMESGVAPKGDPTRRPVWGIMTQPVTDTDTEILKSIYRKYKKKFNNANRKKVNEKEGFISDFTKTSMKYR